MEVGSTIVKTFKRFTIPRSTSSIGSFTTSNGTATSSTKHSTDISPIVYKKNSPQSHVHDLSVRPMMSELLTTNYLPNQSQIMRDTSLDNLKDIYVDNENDQRKKTSTHEHQRTSIKKIFTRKFQPLTTSASISITSKPKKPKNSFRHFSQFLKRSHSTNSDLSTSHENPPTQFKMQNEPSIDHTPNKSTLTAITEEKNAATLKPANSSQVITSHSDSSSLSLSRTSSTSNKQENFVKSSKSSSSIKSPTKVSLTNSISLSNSQSTNERVSVQATMSSANENDSSQATTNVRLRDHTTKKKRTLQDLKLRISLPPNVMIERSKTMHSKLGPRSSNYLSTSSSVNTLNDTFNLSNGSTSVLNLTTTGQLSRSEHRRSMLDLGFGKLESYVKLEKLGEGTYATVFKGTSNLVPGYIALKEIRLEQEEGAPCTALREVSLLKDLKHNNIVNLFDIIFDKTTLTLVFEYVDKDLKQYMDDCANILSMNNVRLFLFQLLRGLEFCHSKKILHRDLKPQNLLINDRGELKLADFGLARIKSFPTKTYSHEVVTLWYRPPDVLLGSTEYSTPIDIWAVGCIFFEMACGRPLFAGTKVDEELKLIFYTLGTPTEKTLPGVTTNPEFEALRVPFYPGESWKRIAARLDDTGIDLLDKFLRYNPHSRISARDAMMHKFFSLYPSEIHTLKPLQSILDIPSIYLTKDHGSRLLQSSLMRNALSKRSSVHL